MEETEDSIQDFLDATELVDPANVPLLHTAFVKKSAGKTYFFQSRLLSVCLLVKIFYVHNLSSISEMIAMYFG